MPRRLRGDCLAGFDSDLDVGGVADCEI